MYLGYMSDMLYSTNRGLLEKKTLFLLKKYSYQLIKNTWAVQCKVFFTWNARNNLEEKMAVLIQQQTMATQNYF